MLAQYWSLIVGGGVVSVTGGVLAWLFQRYRHSAGRELQPFKSYVIGSLRLMVARRLRPMLARRFAVRAYADVTLKEFSRRLPIPSRGRTHIDVERAYIRLSLAASPERRIDDEALLTGEAGSVLVFGEPGSGKSSLTRKLFRDELKNAYLRPFRSRLPLHVELGKLPWTDLPDDRAERLPWLRDILQNMVRRVARVNDADFVFDAFAKGPGLVVFFDGLDEVPAVLLGDAEGLLGDMMTALRHESSDTTVIVTARTQLRSLLTRAFVEGFAEILTVTPFTPADVFAFLRRWDFPSARRLAESQRIFEHLRRNVTLFAMCTNPLVLAMYVAEDELHANHAGSTARLADTRVKFYDQVIGELLYFRRVDQQPDAEPLGSQLLITRQDLLGRIALDHLLDSDDPANVVSLQRAAKLAEQHWAPGRPAEAERDLAQLAVDTGLVTVQQEGQSLPFIHLSICEYLAGKELAERNEQQLNDVLERVAADRPGARRWWETVVFAVALSKRDPRDRAVRQLIDLGAPSDLVLRIIREAQTYDSPEFSQTVTDATAEIASRPAGEWDADWIERVRLMLSCLSDAGRLTSLRHSQRVPTVPEWFAELVAGDSGRLDQVLDLYLAASPAEALRLAGDVGLLNYLFANQERVVLAMEHPDMIALAMRMALPGDAAAEPWISALAEAALRFELVAQTMAEESAPEPLRTAAASVDRQHAWDRHGAIAGTFYGAVMALATAALRGSAWPVVSRVGLVSEVRPGRKFQGRVLMVSMYGASGALGAAFMSLLPFVSPNVLLVIVCLMALNSGFIFRRIGRVGVAWLGTERSLVGLERIASEYGNPMNLYLTRFPDGAVRIYGEGEDPDVGDRVEIAEIRRSLINWRLTPCDPSGHVATVRPPYDMVNLLGMSSLDQAVNVLRQTGSLRSRQLEPHFTFSVFPPRTSEADRPIPRPRTRSGRRSRVGDDQHRPR